MSRYVSLAIAFALMVAVASVAYALQDKSPEDGQDDSKKQQERPEEQKALPLNDPDAVIRRDFMRTKLMYTQNIFHGLTIGDFDAIDEAVKEVESITEGEKWVAIDSEDYRKLTYEFKVSAERLREAAKTRNIEATALRYYDMSTRCIDCHKHIRKIGYAL